LACNTGAPAPEAAVTELGAPPSAAAAAIVRGDRAPLPATFDGGGSTDPDGDLDVHEWDFGDGSPKVIGVKVQHTFEKPGRYVITLVVSDKAGNKGETTVALDVMPPGCPTSFVPTTVGTVNDRALTEISGLAASRRADVLWAHNDSGDTSRIFLLDAAGKRLATYDLGVPAEDWEDMAIGPGPDATKSYLYVGDIGDNEEKRASVVVWRVEEPDPKAASGGKVTGTPLYLRYPDGAHNAETLMVDTNGDLYVVGKRDDGVSAVWLAAAPQIEGTPDEPRTMEKIGEIVFGKAGLPGSPKATAGDISADGKRVVVRTYDSAFLWVREGVSVAEALKHPPCVAMVADEIQGETIAFSPGGTAYFTTSEEVKQPLWRFGLQ
jgi:PKD repeat protein